MKFFLILFTLVYFSDIQSQESLYLLKKDTIFIVFETKLDNKHVSKNYKSIKYLNQKGIKIIYNLLDTIQLNKRKKHYSYLGNINGSVGATYSGFGKFGLYFVFDSTKKVNIDSIFKKSLPYKMIYNGNLKKNKITLKDSIQFDKQIFSQFKTRKSHSILMFSKKELENKNVFIFDGSTKKYKELLNLAKEPHYFYILDKKYNRTVYGRINKKKRGMVKIDYLIFNEVFLETRSYLL